MSLSKFGAASATHPSPDQHVVLGYIGRRVQLLPRHLEEPCSTAPFLDVAHVLDVLSVLTADADSPRMDSVFEKDRDQLITTIGTAHAVFLSAGGGLLAYKSGTPRKWRIMHVRSGAGLDYFHDRSLDDPRPWTRIRSSAGITLSDYAVRLYVDALECLVDPRGVQIDWTADLATVSQRIREWQDYDDTGALPEPSSQSRFGGLRGLSLAATMQAISSDPLREAASETVWMAIDTIVGHTNQMWIRDRHAATVVDYLTEIDRRCNHGRRLKRDRDLRTAEDLRDDRVTGKIITLARLLAFGGQPHRAVTLLLDRADDIRSADVRRKDGVNSTCLRSAAHAIAELFSPVSTQFQRLRGATAGQTIVAAASFQPATSPPSRVWRITTAPQQIWPMANGRERFELGVYELTQHRTGTLHVRPGWVNPLGIDYDTYYWSHSSELLAGRWALLNSGEPIPKTGQEILARAARAREAFASEAPAI